MSSWTSLAAFVVVIGIASLGAGSPPAKLINEATAVAQANNQFALDLYGQLSQKRPGKNLFFSPTSISVALAMTAAGARGETASEMAHALHLTDLPQADAAYRKLLQRWNSDESDRGYTLRIANRLWGQKGFSFLPSYLTPTQQNFGAEMGLVDYAREPEAARHAINAWVEQQTADKIKDLLPKGIVDPTTRLILTNAIYFKGDWVIPFRNTLTRDADFIVSSSQKVKTPLMHQRQSYPILQDDSIQVLELPYKGHDLSMLVMLPKSADGLSALEKSLTESKIAEWLAKLRSKKVDVYLPRFKFDSTTSLGETLQGLGMNLPFTEAADYSGMDGQRDLHISAVIHKAYVEVNETGTEAAAATGVVNRVHASPVATTPAVFRADHPFVFAICDKRDSSILFLGRVVDPKGEQQ